MGLRIAVASGKGGTGKTTFATNLAYVTSRRGSRVAYVDCDVEEPNGHIFLRPEITQSLEATIPVPEVDENRCNGCGACGSACRYSAIVVVKEKVLTFPSLCHGCGGCTLACPEEAIREVPRATGMVDLGHAGPLVFAQGRITIGEAMAPPVIRTLLASVPQQPTVILDAPPGGSCPAMEVVRSADVVLLVTEPTPFGVHDLVLAVEMIRALGKPFAVAVNRADIGNRVVFDYCAKEQIPILFELNHDREIAKTYSRGELITQRDPALAERFLELAQRLDGLAHSFVRPEPTRESESDPEAAAPFATVPSARLLVGPPVRAKELVVLSGKGGTGKTSLVASFFVLAKNAVVADCDVDAADLHLVLNPVVEGTWPFSGGSHAVIDQDACTRCGVCTTLCRFGAIEVKSGWETGFRIDAAACEGCGVCVDACPDRAIRLDPSKSGQWYRSRTGAGPMLHAQLGIAEENSGKLVSLIRQEARAVAAAHHRDLIIVDGSPGVGCPVIASVTGADFVLLMCEPTLSGLHDFERVAALCRHFDVPAAICINKADINLDVAEEIKTRARALGLPFLGSIPYDPDVTRAQVEARPVVTLSEGPATQAIKELWEETQKVLGRSPGQYPMRVSTDDQTQNHSFGEK